MKGTSRRNYVPLALLSLALAAALTIGVSARSQGLTVKAHTAAMQLQSGPEVDELPAKPDQNDKSAACIQRDSLCSNSKPEAAYTLAQERQTPENKRVITVGISFDGGPQSKPTE
jgi:hypothetical protein